MKKMLNLAVFAAISILSIPVLQAIPEGEPVFIDKPALTKGETAILWGTGLAGANVAGRMGSRLGGAVAKSSMAAPAKDPWKELVHYVVSFPVMEAVVREQMKLYLAPLSTIVEQVPLESLGKFVGSLVAGIAGSSGARSAAIYWLAQFHGVSYRLEMISEYYDINLSQYREILMAAASQNRDELLFAIKKIFPLRFGAEWHKRLKHLFDKYGLQAKTLVKKGIIRGLVRKIRGRKRNVVDFVRMIELGAAMANLYYGTKPKPKNTVDSAMKLYKELELLK